MTGRRIGRGRDAQPGDEGAVIFFFFKQKTAYEIGLGIPAEPLFRSHQLYRLSRNCSKYRQQLYQYHEKYLFFFKQKTAYEFGLGIPAEPLFRSRCVEACVYGTLDFVGYPRFPAPVEFIAAVIAYYVHPVNIQTACLIMEGAEFTENIINGVERPVKAAELFAFTLRVRAGNTDVLTDAEENVRQKLRAEGVM